MMIEYPFLRILLLLWSFVHMDWLTRRRCCCRVCVSRAYLIDKCSFFLYFYAYSINKNKIYFASFMHDVDVRRRKKRSMNLINVHTLATTDGPTKNIFARHQSFAHNAHATHTHTLFSLQHFFIISLLFFSIIAVYYNMYSFSFPLYSKRNLSFWCLLGCCWCCHSILIWYLFSLIDTSMCVLCTCVFVCSMVVFRLVVSSGSSFKHKKERNVHELRQEARSTNNNDDMAMMIEYRFTNFFLSTLFISILFYYLIDDRLSFHIL